MKTVEQLLKPVTPDQARQVITAILSAQGFAATTWQPGDLARTFVELLALLYADFTQTLSLIVRSRYNSEASGDWLSLLSASEFSNVRFPATATNFDVLLSAAVSGAGPYSVASGENILQDPDGNIFRNIAAGSISGGGETTLRYQADVTGYLNPIGLVMQTPLAGVTMTVVEDSMRTGTAEETDERLRTRNVSRWATLSYASPQDAYKKWALEAVAEVTRVRVDDQNPDGPGTIDVYIAGEGPLVGDEDEVVLAYINGADGVGRRPLGSIVRVLMAEELEVVVAGTVYYDPLYSATVDADVRAALIAYFKALPIGGYGGLLPVAGIYGAVMRVRGVVNMALSEPLTNLEMGETEAEALRAVAILLDTEDEANGGGLLVVPVTG